VVVALSVSPLSADLLVVSADKSGVVVLWRFPAEGAAVRGDGSVTRVFTTKEKWGIDSTVQCLKCSPYNEDEVAVGCVSSRCALDCVRACVRAVVDACAWCVDSRTEW
jgi:hypothetical protein